jgi:hypothetical protein
MIPLATTQLSIARTEPADQPYDPYDSPAVYPTQVATGVRAVITAPTANAVLSGGNQVVYAAKVTADLCDLQAGDTVTDATGLTWTVLWARQVLGFGLDHMEGQLRLVEGAAA